MLGLAPLAIGIGSSLIGRALKGGGQRTPRAAPNFGLDSRIQKGLATADLQESKYLEELDAFDPRESFGMKMQADLDAFDEDFSRTFAGKIGNLYGNGRGLSVSGFGVRDAQDTITEGQRQRARIRQQNEDALAQMQLNRLGMKGGVVTGRANRYWDAAVGRQNTLEAQRAQDAASKRSLFGSIIGAGATAAGAYFGR